MKTVEAAQVAKSVVITAVFSPSARSVVEQVLQLGENSTVGRAVEIVSRIPGFEMLKNLTAHRLTVVIWGQKADSDQLLQSGDRLEICRLLVVDPKVARRLRFKGQGAKIKSAGLFAKRRDGAKAGY